MSRKKNLQGCHLRTVFWLSSCFCKKHRSGWIQLLVLCCWISKIEIKFKYLRHSYCLVYHLISLCEFWSSCESSVVSAVHNSWLSLTCVGFGHLTLTFDHIIRTQFSTKNTIRYVLCGLWSYFSTSRWMDTEHFIVFGLTSFEENRYIIQCQW